MKYFTETISAYLAEKLKEKGMSIAIKRQTFAVDGKYKYDPATTYAQVFDWLMSEKGWLISIGREYDFAAEQVTERFEWDIEKVGYFSSQPDNGGGWSNTWHKAANAAIEKALTLI